MKKQTIAVELRAAADLKPSRTNSRVHSDEQIDQIVASINTFGWTKPVLADGDEIVAGHGATRAALRVYEGGGTIRMAGSGTVLPAGMVPVLDCIGWTEEQRRAYVIADNRIAENSTWDESLLKAELLFLEDEEFFSPKSSVFAHKAGEAPGAMASGGGVHIGQLIIQEASNAAETARQVKAELRGLLRGAHSDSVARA